MISWGSIMCLCVHLVDSEKAGTSRRHKTLLRPGDSSRHVRSQQQREKGAYVSDEVVKASDQEFLLGASSPSFLGMHWFRFPLEASWETVTFAFFIVFLFIIQPLQKTRKIDYIRLRLCNCVLTKYRKEMENGLQLSLPQEMQAQNH